MSPAADKAPSWAAEAAGALNATAATLPFVLSFGFFAYGALGDLAASAGLTASLVAVVIGGAAMLVFSRAQLPVASPSTSASLILGGAVITMLRDARLAPTSGDGLALLLAATSIVVLASGLLMIALGLAGAGRLVRYVPRPVLAGFMNGIAILLVVSQLPPLLGLPPDAWARDGLRSLAAWQVLPIAIALGTALLLVLIRWRWPKAPASILAMAGAGVVVALWQAQAEPGSAAASLQRVGTLVLTLPRANTLAPWLDTATWRALAPHAGTLVTTTLVLALIGAMESVLNLAAVDELISATSNPDRELIALGGANVVSGALGGLPLVYLRLRALATWSGGGRSRRSVWLGCAFIAPLVILASPLIERLPTAVLAGVVVMLAWALADQWTRQLVRRWWAGQRSAEIGWNLAVVALVCAVTLGWGFTPGVLAGIVVAVWIFVRAMNRQLVRARFTAATLPSRRVYGASDEKRLATLRERIVVLELEGALFFGSAERLLDEADRLPAGAATLIVDLRRVSNVDASGAATLAKVAQQLGRRGIVMRLAGVQPGNRHGRALADHGVSLSGPGGLLVHPDLDRALEAAERDALAADAAHTPSADVPLAQCHLFDGLSLLQAASLAALLRERRLDAGERLFHQSDTGRTLYLLTAGSISIVDPQRGQRFVSFQPGMCLGETAVLDGGGRTGDAVADVPSVVHELDIDDFHALQREQPELSAQVYRNLATHLSQRLRAAAAAWRHSAE